MTRGDRRWLTLILALGAVLRLGFILAVDPAPNLSGGDVGWYLDKGRLLVANRLDFPVQTGPTFLVYVGLVQGVVSDPLVAMRAALPFWRPHVSPVLASTSLTITVLRLLNIGWHLILVGAVYILGKRYFNPGTARLAALVTAISPAFIIETGLPLTESLFIALLFSALALYSGTQNRPRTPRLVFVGGLIGLAALTRVVALLFPAVLVLHLVWLHGWRKGAQWGVILVTAFGLTVSTWTAYNLWRWNRFIIGGEGLTAFAWMGVTGITDPYAIDTQIGETAARTEQRDQAFIEGFLNALIHDLPGWIKIRLSNLIEATLQPHNTVYFPGESLKALASIWVSTDRSLSGLIQLSQSQAFWQKLGLYAFHFWAWGAGVLGLIAHWRQGRRTLLPLYGLIVYILSVHVVILAIPRYLFPIEPALYLFGATLTVGVGTRLLPRKANQDQPSMVQG